MGYFRYERRGSGFPYPFLFYPTTRRSQDLMADAVAWCQEQFGDPWCTKDAPGIWYNQDTDICFRLETHACLFRLRWC